jgi:hypothetical protein
MDSGLLVDRNQAKACPCLCPKNNYDNIHVLQSPCGIIQISSKPNFTSAGR